MILEPGMQIAVLMGQEADRPHRKPYEAIYRGVMERSGKRHESFDTTRFKKGMIILANVAHHADSPRHLVLGYDQVAARDGDRIIDVLTGEEVE
jgi:hypothetical protein